MERRRHARRNGNPRLDGSILTFLQVIWRLEHAVERASKRMEDTIGISGPQRFALRLLGHRPGLGAGELAQAMHLHPSTVTGMIQRLEVRGYVKRVAHPTDGRRMHLHLTPAGARVTRARPTIEHAVRTTRAQCPAAKQRAAADLLDRFSRELMKL
jgi:MarR family transcriptional regulator, organic hydroperoxide resistance regulator